MPSRVVGQHSQSSFVVVGDGLLWVSALIGLLGMSVPILRGWAGLALLVLVPGSLVLSLPTVSRLALLTSMGMIGAGLVLSVSVGASLVEIGEALVTMAGLFGFIAIVRLIELPILRRHVDRVLAVRLSNAKRSGSMLVPGGLLTYALALVLSFGALPAAYRSVHQMLGDSPVGSSVGLVSRSFIAANSITPLSPPIALCLSVVGVAWTAYAPIGLVLTAFGLALLGLGPRTRGRMHHLDPLPGQGRVSEFVTAVAVIFGLVITLQLVLPGGVVSASVVAVALVVPVWEFMTGGRKSFFPRVVALATTERRSWRDQYALLVASALLVAAAVHWGHSADVLAAIESSDVSLVIVIAAVPITMVVMALLGVYPMALLFLACTTLPALGGDSWDVLVVAAAVLGAHVGFMVSPLSGMTLLMSAMSGTSSVRVGLRWNLPFGLAFLTLGTAVLALVVQVTT